MESESSAATEAERIIRDEISRRGPISFARFMELALYEPGAGYYEKAEGPTGRGGDYYTSVSVGPVLGFLLAHWVAGIADGDDGDGLDLVEAAAHDGQLAADVLEALGRFRPEILARVRYRILEPSKVRRRIQQGRLAGWGAKVSWSTGWDDVPEPVRGVVFSNELLDAMPVHRWVWDRAAGRWQEWGVTVTEGGLTGCRLEVDAGRIPADWVPLEGVLPDGYVVERSDAAEAWWRRAGESLERGVLMALDYGFDDASRIRPERTNGTARAYCRHRVSDDLLACPGEQDLTAHVDFPRLIEIGEAGGLRTVDFLPQGRWLGRLVMEILGGGGASAGWLAGQTRGMQTLIHPEHLGHSLRVLVQARP